jgi:hypothetical protein
MGYGLHRSLGKDAPCSRPIERFGGIVAYPILGGLYHRCARSNGLIYLDLADEFWRCVEIGPSGWRIAEDPPVRFRRCAGMQSLPLPVRGGSIESLAPFLNLASENDFVLVVAWLLGALRAGGPFPVLAIAGEQGSAKTVLSKLLRALIRAWRRCGPCRAMSGSCSSLPAMATSSPSTISAACRPGCRTPLPPAGLA